MGPATASGTKGLRREFAKQLGGGDVIAIIQHERGSFQRLLSLSHHALSRQDHVGDSTADWTEDKEDHTSGHK